MARVAVVQPFGVVRAADDVAVVIEDGEVVAVLSVRAAVPEATMSPVRRTAECRGPFGLQAARAQRFACWGSER
jgi:hypothetical protein